MNLLSNIRQKLSRLHPAFIKDLPITHRKGHEKLSKQDIQAALDRIEQRLLTSSLNEDQKPRLLKMAQELSEFELGRFLLQNGGALSGYWTHYLISGHDLRAVDSSMERFILMRAPIVIATRERFHLFQQQLQKWIRSDMRIASIPCGLMADLVTLKLDSKIKNIEFVGFDLDETQFNSAQELARQHHCQVPSHFIKRNAWELNEFARFDIITSNGLNIYEADDNKVIELYQQFYTALKPGGKLITSAITVPPGQDKPSEWDMNIIDFFDLEKQVALFSQVLNARWSHFRSSDDTVQQLKTAGFNSIEIIWDKQRIFPTFVANKN